MLALLLHYFWLLGLVLALLHLKILALIMFGGDIIIVSMRQHHKQRALLSVLSV